MKGLHLKKGVWNVLWILLGVFVLAGCAGWSYRPSPPFPAPVPEDAKITKNYNSKGQFFFADQKGEVVSTKPMPFGVLLQKSDTTEPNWMKVLGCFTVYRIPNHSNVWLCDKDSRCLEGTPADKANGAVFSVNFDGKKLFIADASGRSISEKDLKKFASLVRDTDPDSRAGIRLLDTFTIYKIKGSIRIADCCENICFCTCFDETTWHQSACDRHGACP